MASDIESPFICAWPEHAAGYLFKPLLIFGGVLQFLNGFVRVLYIFWIPILSLYIHIYTYMHIGMKDIHMYMYVHIYKYLLQFSFFF